MARKKLWPAFVALSVDDQAHDETGALLALLQGTQLIGDLFRQHRHDAVREIHRVAAQACFMIEAAAGTHVMRHIGDGHVHDPTAGVARLAIGCRVYRIVMIARIGGIDGDEIEVAQVAASRQRRRLELGNLGQHVGGEFVWNAVRVHGDQADFALVVWIAERFQHARLRQAVATGA